MAPNSAAMEETLAGVLNGLTGAGLSTMGERAPDTEFRLPIGLRPQVSLSKIRSWILMTFFGSTPEDADKETVLILTVMGYVTVSRSLDLHGAKSLNSKKLSSSHIGHVRKEFPAHEAVPADVAKGHEDYAAGYDLPTAAQAAWNVLYASKICFYKQNHHVGQEKGKLPPVLTKALTVGTGLNAAELFCQDSERSRSHRAALHAACHWPSSSGWLKCVFGATGSGMASWAPETPEAEVAKWLAASPDFLCRVRSNPSGTSSAFVQRETLRLWLNSFLKAAFPAALVGAANGLVTTCDAVMKRPLAYHPSAGLHLVDGQTALDPTDDDLAATLKAYISVIRSKSTLAQSPFWDRVEVDADMRTTLAQITTTLAGAGLEGDELIESIKAAQKAAGVSHTAAGAQELPEISPVDFSATTLAAAEADVDMDV